MYRSHTPLTSAKEDFDSCVRVLDSPGTLHGAVDSRRRFVLGAITVATLAPLAARSEPYGWSASVEEQRGDITLPFESIEINPKDVYSLSGSASRASFEPRAANFADIIADTGHQFIGKTRENARPQIGDMLELFNLPFEDKRTKKPLPFCACGLAYVAALAYLESRHKQKSLSTMQGLLADLDHYHFFPSPSVWDMYFVALGKRRWVPVGSRIPERGWVVIYDFGKGADHVGLILSADSTNIHTFECNTSGTIDSNQQNGGVITTKTRVYRNVKGYVRTDLETPV